MPRKKTREEFIEQAAKKHGGKYDYSKVEYKNDHTPVKLKCNRCGTVFEQIPMSHLRGSGCDKCNRKVAMEERIKRAAAKFKKQATLKHNSKYTYDRFVYKGAKFLSIITCPIHGDFKQTPGNHLTGYGCDKCAREKKHAMFNQRGKESFLSKVKKNHPYDYQEFEYFDDYQRSNKEIQIKHLVCGNVFPQNPNKHLMGEGCPFCKSSRLEKEIRFFLQENDIEFIEQYNRQWLGLQKLDFYLPKYKIAIECQGEQHFVDRPTFGSENHFIENTEKDKLKLRKCINNGIKLLYYSNLGIEYPYHVFEDKEELLKEIKKYDINCL